jgi:cell division protein FtsI/penicillin-binding protein 2/cell division protein FtsW (lipid II flippase)
MMFAPSRSAIGYGRSAVLLLLPSLLLIAGPFTVLLARDRQIEPDVVTAGLIVSFLPLLTPLLLRLVEQRWDPLLLSPVWVLCALGLTVVARVQADLLTTQMLWIGIGWCLFIALAGLPPLLRWVRTFRYVWLAGALVLTGGALLLGDDVTGQGMRIWLRLGPVTVQPGEVLRVALIVFLAAYLSDHRGALSRSWWRDPLDARAIAPWLPLAGVVSVAVLIVVAQRDFGPSLVYVATFLGLLYLAAGRREQVFVIGGAFVVAGAMAVVASDRLRERFGAWLDPWGDPQGAGYQSLQAIGGFVFGGVTGAGPGNGYPGLIPAAHTDYPLAVIGEEWGLLGALAVITLYGLLVVRGLVLARGSNDRFAQLLGAGLALSLGVQVLIVFGGVLRLIPLTGLTSPFLSYGGSSMLMGWIMVALLLRSGSTSRSATAPVPFAGVVARMRHVGVVLLAGFVVLAGTLGYWQVVRADALAADPAVSGQRLRLETARITRGSLLDRNGEVLAETVIGPGGVPERRYTEPSAIHVVGFDSSWLGATGAEALAADALMGRRQQTPDDTLRDLLRLDRSGADVRLTIDAALQRAAAQAMGDAAGAVIALDPRTGDVLALVSNPTYRPDLNEEEWAALRTDPASPLLNRATQGLYTPGSTFKTVTLAAALEYGLVQLDSPAKCADAILVEGVRVTSDNEPPGRGTETVADAYAYSCNTYFAELGVVLGEDRFLAMAESLGLVEEPPITLPASRGRLSNTAEFLASDAGLATSAFGQGELQLTPLHLALVTAAVANEGQMPRPRIFLDDAPSTWRQAMSPATAQALSEAMEYGVEAGWAAPIGISGTRIGAKTGSAEVAAGGESHALIISFAPVDDPGIVVVVVRELAGSGSREAAPVARAVIDAWLGNARTGASSAGQRGHSAVP